MNPLVQLTDQETVEILFLNPMFNSCVTNKCSSSNKQFSIHPVTITSMAKFDVLKVSDNSELNIDTKTHKKGLRQSAKSEGYYYCYDCDCYGGKTKSNPNL